LTWLADGILVSFMDRGGFLSSDERGHLEALVRRPTERHGIARRANAMLLLDDGLRCEDVARVLYLDDDTIRGWRDRYLRDGARALAVFGWKGGQRRLAPAQEAELVATLDAGFFPTTAAVSDHVARAFGVRFSKAGTIKLLHRLDFEWRKPKGLPARVDVAAQRAFVTAYEALMNRLEPDELVYFADAVHPEYQSRPACGWVRRGVRPAVRKGKGRRRVNLAGALCLETGDLRLVEDERITAETTVKLLARLERANPGKRLHVILDNAATHRAPPVQAWLARPGCRTRLIFLPAYAPNLNAIERLWQVMHRHVTHNTYHADFRSFAEAVMRFFTTTLPERWHEIRETVSDNFHIIDPGKFRLVG
jgi:transposase